MGLRDSKLGLCLLLDLWVTRTFSPFVLSDENEAEMAEKAADDEEDDSSNSSDGDDDEEGAITEIRFVPSDKAACEWPLRG